jgi:iron complex transport system substrate-binding protein
VANAVQVNYEQIVLLKPDLIITTNLTKARTIDTFRKLGLKTVVFDNPKDFNEICAQFLELGNMVGAPKKAARIIDDARLKIEQISASIPSTANDKSLSVFMQLGANPLFTVVPETFMHDYMALSGTRNIAADLSIGSINLESVLLRDPDVIFIVLMGMVGNEEMARWQSFGELSAVRNKRIYTLDADKACSPTPLSFVETLEDLVNHLYRDQ